MNKTVYLLFTIALLLTGCSEMPVNEEKDCEISFNLSGEITTSETPLTKSLSSEDLLFVQVYRGDAEFACGIFDNLGSMKLNLKQGSEKYRMVFSLVKNGKSLLGSEHVDGDRECFYFNSAVNAIRSVHNYEFFDINGSASNELMAMNDFWYNSVGQYTYYDRTGQNKTEGNNRSLSLRNITRSTFERAELGEFILCYTPVKCDDWFYGEITDYSPQGTTDTLSVNLVRTGFKFKYEVTGITDGEVDLVINDSGGRRMITNTISSSSYSSDVSFYSFNSVRNAWLYSDDYSETFSVSVVWHRGIGVTQELGSTTFLIKRNCLNNIKINLGSNDQSAGMNLTVEAENTIGSDSVTIPVQ